MTLCAQGHFSEGDADWAGYSVAPKCVVCGSQWVWSYTVDQTNDAGVKPELELLAPAVNVDTNVYYQPSPVKPAQWRDLDHPQDGPFATEALAYANKDRHYKAMMKKAKHETRKNRH